MPAQRLTEHVWLVGSGEPGPAFTDEHDGHSYLVRAGDGTCLIVDCGTGRGAAAWLANLDGVCERDAVVGVVLTHYHADHAGGAAAAVDSGFDVFADPVTSAALKAGDEEVTSLALARDAGVYPPDYVLSSTGLSGIADDIVLGDLRMLVEPTPGHCDGHLAFRLIAGDTPALFSGDCLFRGGMVSVQAIHDCRLRQYAITVQRLAERRTEQLFPGHGPPALSAAGTDIERAAATFRSLRIPPNFLDAARPQETRS